MQKKRAKKIKLTLKFSEVTKKQLAAVGGKNASLGEMIRFLSSKGVVVPDGFVVTAQAYKYFLDYNGLFEKISQLVNSIKIKKIKDLKTKGAKIRKLIFAGKFPPSLEQKIIQGYCQLQKKYGKKITVACRSSATAEDLPGASFAGQHDSFLNLETEDKVLEGVKRCFASLFNDRAISYRLDKGFEHMKVYLAVGVQLMVAAAAASSGVIFTIDPDTGFRDAIFINAAWGLGEYVVQGIVNPDQYIVFKPTLAKGFYPILDKKLGKKDKKLITSHDLKKPTKNKKTSQFERNNFCLKDKEIIALARWARIIENHYGAPQDIEWAKDGRTGQLYIIQARPETVRSVAKKNILEEYALAQKGKLITTGYAIGSKIGQGKARIILNAKKIKEFRPGEVLVTTTTDPDWEPVMKIASAIVTDRGGRTSHAAIVSRELGIPAVVGTNNATLKIKNNQKITVSSATGEVGKVYQGLLKYKVKKIDLKKFRRPKTKIMMNLGDPDQAFSASLIPNDGVGLAREEFIITATIGAHPLALVHYDKLKDRKIKKKIALLTQGYKDKRKYFVDRLSSGMAKIAAAFYPKEVTIRTSDFKTNEYRGLLGGSLFEAIEENPMIGFRGAARYLDRDFRPAFSLECQAFKKAREQMGFSNIKIMLPFVRTPEEGKKAIEIMAREGLVQHEKGLKIYAMCEIPSNIILAKEFLKIFDGLSIGSNDLAQLILGLDRDNPKVGKIADERHEAVKKAIVEVIKIARAQHKKIGICGQAPSDFPEFARFLVKNKISSLSLNPDTVLKTTLEVLGLGRKQRKK